MLPSGTVTLLLSDIEGSTRLWETRSAEMAEAIAALDVTLADAVERHHGVRPVEQGEGDSFVIAFTRARDAVDCALALQRATVGGPLRLRMGVHTGDVQLRDEGNYIGPAVNRAARIRDAGHGGQVLLSQTAADLVIDDLPDGVSLIDLGEHRLRDLGRLERIWEVDHVDLPGPHPPLRSLGAVHNNLPVPLTSFVGRQEEMAEVHELLNHHRALTLTGSGGCGKTRLAVQVAASRLDAHPGGVWFVDLATVNDPDGVAAAAVEALGLVVNPSSSVETVARALGASAALLVLDNCEHLVQPSASLADALLRRCPGLVVMTTSREPLGIEGEVTFRVPSLSLPPTARAVGVDEIAGSEAVALFAERGRRARPQFALDAGNADAIVEICRRLDGIPLALELAAARLRVLTPAQIRDGLHDRFRLLTGGARTAVPRQQALQASVDWSYALLLDAERLVLKRLSVFAGGFTLAAAEAVCAGDGLERHHIFDLVAQLVDKSLVVADVDSGADTVGRFTLLETVRTYAAGKLAESGDADTTRLRHYEFFSDLAKLEPARTSEGEYRRQVAADYDNLRRALQWAAESSDPARLARLATRLYLYWTTGTRMVEGSRWYARVAEAETDPGRRATVLARYALLLFVAGDEQRSGPAAHEAVEAARALGDPRGLAWSLLFLGQGLPPVDERVAVLEEALALTSQLGDEQGRAFALQQLGFHLHDQDPASAVEALEEASRISREHGYEWIENLARTTLALVALNLGEVAAALPKVREAVDALRAAGEGNLIGTALAYEAMLLDLTGDRQGADAAAAVLDALVADAGSVGLTMRRHFGRAMVALFRGDWEGASDANQRCLSLPITAHFRGLVHSLEAQVAALSGEVADALDHAREARDLSPHWVGDNFFGPPELALAVAARHVGELDRAEDLAHAAIADVHARPMAAYVRAGSIQILAGILARSDQVDRIEAAARLFGGVAALLDRVGVAPGNRLLDAEAGGGIEVARERLGDQRFDQLWAEGQATSWDDLVAFAGRGRGRRGRPRSGWASLTPTEHQVVGLVSAGASNAEISEKLFMSVPTVKSHLTHIYGKLGLASRHQLAAEAARHSAVSDPG